jgi:hypothetical protein
MRKLIALVVMLAAVPAMASVDIGASASMVDANTALVTITYDATSEANLVRAFALDIAIVGDPNINVIDVNCVNGDYLIYPGSNGIEISGGAVTSYGSCACNASDHPDTLGGVGTDDGVTIEMASLYEAGVDPAPGKGPATLAEITIQGCGDANVVVTENAIRGGVVMEGPDEVVTVNMPADVELTLVCETLCLKVGQMVGGNMITQAMFDLWDSLGQPASWCYDCHYRCDTDGDCDVDAGDVQVIIGGWSVYNADADTDNSGAIDASDIQNMIAGWQSGCGTCTPEP